MKANSTGQLLLFLILSAACSGTTRFERVDDFPVGLQIATFTSAWTNRLQPSQVSEDFALAHAEVWRVAKIVAQRLEKRRERVETLIDEQAGSIRLIDEQQIREVASDADEARGLGKPARSRLSGWKDEFLIQVVAVSPEHTRVIVSRAVLGIPRFRFCLHVAALCERGTFEPEVSNGQIEKWVLTQIADELARVAASRTTRPSTNSLSYHGEIST